MENLFLKDCVGFDFKRNVKVMNKGKTDGQTDRQMNRWTDRKQMNRYT